MKEALFYNILPHLAVQCDLCPHNCRIPNGKLGICQARRNTDGVLMAETYGNLTAIHTDPIEKKPLYHFYPGSNILSIGSFGCNLKCDFCQNCSISQASMNDFPDIKNYSTTEILKIAGSEPKNIGLAYTYNEPAIFFEFMLETSNIVKSAGLMNVMVSNGFINRDPLHELIQSIDAFNIDLKAFNNEFFRRYTGSALKPVLETLVFIRHSGRHLEITNLVIPGLNDDEATFKKMVNWISKELGSNTVLHLSRYFPAYKANTDKTALASLVKLASLAREQLEYVYIGNANIPEFRDTHCPKCNSLLVSRIGYSTRIVDLDADGGCHNCKYKTGISCS